MQPKPLKVEVTDAEAVAMIAGAEVLGYLVVQDDGQVVLTEAGLAMIEERSGPLVKDGVTLAAGTTMSWENFRDSMRRKYPEGAGIAWQDLVRP